MKQILCTSVNAIKSLFLMAIGATLVISAQAVGVLPFYNDGHDLFKWLADDPRVGLWLQPGYFYLMVMLFMAIMVIMHTKLAQHLQREQTVIPTE